MKKNNLFLALLFLIFANLCRAQIGTITGKGMSICQDYSFTVCPPQVITPDSYGTEKYLCDNNNYHGYIAFVPQGSGWRVEILSWKFVASGTGATISGIDPAGNTITHTFAAGDILKPSAYTTISGVDYVTFQINGLPIGSGFTVKKTNFQIALTASAQLASFLLGTTSTGLQGSSTASGSHTWTVYRANACNVSPYTLLGTFNTQTFSIDSPGPCYYVIHKLVTSCGEICAAQFTCASACEEKVCNLMVPSGLSIRKEGLKDILTWIAVSGATSYAIEININDPACCDGEKLSSSPIIIQPIHTNSYALDFTSLGIDPDKVKCYSWRVIAYCPDGGKSMSGFQCSSESISGRSMGINVKKLENIQVNVYPNPAKGLISIEIINNNTDYSIDILDITGKRIKAFDKIKSSDNKSNIKWNTDSLSQGEYLIKITTSDNQVFFKKFIKE